MPLAPLFALLTLAPLLFAPAALADVPPEQRDEVPYNEISFLQSVCALEHTNTLMIRVFLLTF